MWPCNTSDEYMKKNRCLYICIFHRLHLQLLLLFSTSWVSHLLGFQKKARSSFIFIIYPYFYFFFMTGSKEETVEFKTRSGILKATQEGESSITLDFPINPPSPYEAQNLQDIVRVVAGNLEIQEVHHSATTKKLLLRLADKYNRFVNSNRITTGSCAVQLHDRSVVVLEANIDLN